MACSVDDCASFDIPGVPLGASIVARFKNAQSQRKITLGLASLVLYPTCYLGLLYQKQDKNMIFFLQIDENDGIADGILNIDNLQCALQVMEYSLPQHKIRVLVEDLENKDKLVNGGVDKNLFIEVRTQKPRAEILEKISLFFWKI